MAGKVPTEIDSLAAPARDGDMLLWPRDPAWSALAEANRRLRRSYAFRILDRSFRELLRDELQGPPVIMTGHQPGFIHPGVWVKNIVTSSLGARLDGEAWFLVVDSDAVPRSALAWPETTDDYYRVATASGPPWFAGRSWEQLPAVMSEEWRAFFDRLPEQWRNDAASAMPTFLRGFVDESPAADYVSRWISGITAAERAFGVTSPRFIRDSELWSRRPGLAAGSALAFTSDLLLNADEFQVAYNQALGAYRERRGIRGRQHPIPDLLEDADRVETPFWVLRSSQPRRRLLVSQRGSDAIQLWAATEPLCTLRVGDLASKPVETLTDCLGGWQVRPRALVLTMFARLAACDLFVHGIGGAKYDQVTDDIIRRFFGVEPPAYACASATCHLPLAKYDVTKANLAAWMRRSRDLGCNPQRYLAASSSGDQADRAAAVAESIRLRREEPHRHDARRDAFGRIRQTNAALLRSLPDVVAETNRRLAEIRAQLDHNLVAANREWFFALFPTAQLLRLPTLARRF